MPVAVAVHMDSVRLASVADQVPMDTAALLTVAQVLQTVGDHLAHDANSLAINADAAAGDIDELQMVAGRLPLDSTRPANAT